MNRAKVVVVGAGVVGAAIAEAVSRTGRSVRIIEQGVPGGAVSGASLACISTHMQDKEELPFLIWNRDQWAALHARRSGFEYARCGQLRFLRSEDEIESARYWIDTETACGLEPELLEPEAIRHIEPMLTGPIAAATWSLDSAVVNPFLAVRMLLEDAQAQGAQIQCHARATAVRVEHGCVVGVDTTRGPVDGDVVIIAGGPWTAQLAASVDVHLPIRPRKAQCLATVSQPLSIRTVVGACKSEGGVGVGYTQIQQSMSGQILFNTVLANGVEDSEDPDHVPEVDRSFIRDSIETFLFLFPGFADVELLRSWVRHEAVTPDNRFLVGPIGPTGLFVAAGDGGTGFTRAIGIGRVIADQLDGRESPFRTDIYDPSRFARGLQA
ncbi:NAD(P)/FAD-dependent oxidoreductase [Variovorax sp. YR566]|uniref:NAD(P)/FAD-dependent oxidoreductase n=1 Tax=Variovorax sp. YR566 TaxID=3450237 RepID=UPI003F7FE625